MTITLERAARMLQMPPEQLWQESLRAYVSREKRLAHTDIADLQDRYGVSDPQELTKRIQLQSPSLGRSDRVGEFAGIHRAARSGKKWSVMCMGIGRS